MKRIFAAAALAAWIAATPAHACFISQSEQDWRNQLRGYYQTYDYVRLVKIESWHDNPSSGSCEVGDPTPPPPPAWGQRPEKPKVGAKVYPCFTDSISFHTEEALKGPPAAAHWSYGLRDRTIRVADDQLAKSIHPGAVATLGEWSYEPGNLGLGHFAVDTNVCPHARIFPAGSFYVAFGNVKQDWADASLALLPVRSLDEPALAELRRLSAADKDAFAPIVKAPPPPMVAMPPPEMGPP